MTEERGTHSPDPSTASSSARTSPPQIQYPMLGPEQRLRETWTLTKAREGLRGAIATWLLAILTLVVIAALIDVSILMFTAQTPTINDLRTVLEILVTPLVGLIGAVTGFYFGTRALGEGRREDSEEWK
jgi:hypothetical protein